MNKNSIIVLISGCLIFSLFIEATTYVKTRQDRCRKYHSSFMFTRPILQNVALLKSAWDITLYHKNSCRRGSFQTIGFYQRSVDEGRINGYFLFGGKKELLVAGDQSINAQFRDVRAEWLSLPSIFEGTVSLIPKQTQAGCLLSYRQELDKLFSISFLQDYWLQLDVPVLMIDQELEVRQDIIMTDESVYPKDIKQALGNHAFRFGRLEGRDSRVALADVAITFGKTYRDDSYFLLEYYNF